MLKQRGYDPEAGRGYEREKEAYLQLRHLQGSLIPRYYGEVFCGCMPAIIISEEAGRGLLEHPMTEQETERVLTAVRATFKLFAEAGVIHGDPEPHNLLWDGERLVVVDFNCSLFYTGEEARRYMEGDYREVERRLSLIREAEGKRGVYSY